MGVSVNQKSIIITGGGSGIGAATVLLATRSGALVTIADMNADLGNQVHEQVKAEGGGSQFIRADISSEHDVKAMIEAALAKFKRLDGAFNNAGISAYSHQPNNGVFALFAELPSDAFETCHRVNTLGTFLCMKYELGAMLQGGGGAIVNNASNAGILAVSGAADYVSSKHAVIGLTKAAALDYAKSNIRVNAVLPGVVRTPLMEESFAHNPALVDWALGVQPNGRFGKPSEIAEAALWLLSDAASFVTGISMSVDGGYAIV